MQNKEALRPSLKLLITARRGLLVRKPAIFPNEIKMLRRVLLLASLPLLFSSCCTGVGVKGAVYESSDSSTVTGIFDRNNCPDLSTLKPLKKVEVVLAGGKSSGTLTDTQGEFNVGFVTGPCGGAYSLTLSKAGYSSVTVQVENRANCIVILKRK